MSRITRSIAMAAAVLLLAAPAAMSQGEGKAAKSQQPEAASPKPAGLEVGAMAPKFTLKDQEGKERTLGEFLGKGKVALVFYRSANW